MIGRKAMRIFLGHGYYAKQWQKFSTETLKNVFSNAKKGLQETSSVTFSALIFFMFVLLISNHMFFFLQFEINLHLWVFQKAEIALAEAVRAISAFQLKNSLAQINSKLNSNPHDYLYKSTSGSKLNINSLSQALRKCQAAAAILLRRVYICYLPAGRAV